MPTVTPGVGSPEGVALMRRVADGDGEALGALFDAHAPLAYGLIQRVLGPTSDADQVLHEVFWQVWLDAGSHDPTRGSPEAWLLNRARSRAIDRLRASRRRGETSADEPTVTPGLGRASEGPASSASALAVLPVRDRQVIELAFFEGLTQAEMTRRLGEPLGTVKTRTRTGLARLREHLRGTPPARSHEAYAQLLPAYALGILERDERARVETHLRVGCPDCEHELMESGETLGKLAAEASPVAPPPAVRARLVERVSAEPTAAAPNVLARLARLRRLAWPLVWAATVVIGAAVVASLAVSAANLRRDLARRAGEQTTHQVAVARLEKQLADRTEEARRQTNLVALLSAPDARVITLSAVGPSPAARGRVWWRGAGQPGFFVVIGLPPAPEGKSYQLWVTSAGTPVSGSVFTVDDGGAARVPVAPLPGLTRPEAFSVTVEPDGGSPAPSGPVFLLAKLI
jgi:RNA polymerase sigma-70 factor (ECF subfamily)